ncbi:hypothetical protein [Nitrosomonas aestuarii]|uniref:hypothetical protein n=1 Tax=Nitrosomonas aestuarii TaxID=52441 RepID=UPI000D30954E|nr:hypothetical protein [Nitrosomonas aestuarii]PTN12838.1 hypothetical protein C8R11_102113 [Nitrosomonas aestuarii]
MTSVRSREIRLWWPLPLAVLLWVVIIWAFGFFMAKSEEDASISIPDAIEAEFLELPEPGQQQQPTPPPPKGAETQPQNDTQQAKIPPPPRTRPIPPPSAKRDAIETAKMPPPKEKTGAEAPQTKEFSEPTDLSEYINQRKQPSPASKRSAGIFDGVENAQNMNAEPQPSAEEIRIAKVKRNLQMPGISGIFQITQIGPRYARFTFRSWTTNLSNPRRELIEVEAGPDGDIERAVVRRMIQLIRQYHQEDFNWESQRLNRVIVLSARPGDTEGLENFLMREFFGEPLPPYMR